MKESQKNFLDEVFASVEPGMDHNICLTRRGFLLGSLFAALALGIPGTNK